jgi:hypothetical protein
VSRSADFSPPLKARYMTVPCCIQSTSYCTACSKEFVLVTDSDSGELNSNFEFSSGGASAVTSLLNATVRCTNGCK